MWPVRWTKNHINDQKRKKTTTTKCVVYKLQRRWKTKLVPINIFHQKLPFTVNCLAAVVWFTNLLRWQCTFVSMTLQLQSATPNYPLGRSGKCRPQISMVLWAVYETIAQGKKRKNNQERGVWRALQSLVKKEDNREQYVRWQIG